MSAGRMRVKKQKELPWNSSELSAPGYPLPGAVDIWAKYHVSPVQDMRFWFGVHLPFCRCACFAECQCTSAVLLLYSPQNCASVFGLCTLTF